MPPTDALAPLAPYLEAAEATSAEALEVAVRAHLAEIRAAYAGNEFIDLPLAEAIADRCLALLEALPGLPPLDRRRVRAACLYFIASDDDEDDLGSIFGLDDDAEVLNAVIDSLSLDIPPVALEP